MRVGEEIESICGKCGDVWHVIAAIANGKVAKVVCKRCGTQHRHKPPGGAEPAAKSSTASGAGRAPKAAGGAAKRRGSKKVAEPAGPRIDPDLARPVKSYRPADRYLQRDRIEHRTFGVGVVEEILGPGKIQVWFDGGQKVLVHGAAPAA